MKYGLIIAEEYRRRVLKRSFLIMTIATPLLLAALIVVPLLLSGIEESDDRSVALIDNTGLYGEALSVSDDYTIEPLDLGTQDVAAFRANSRQDYRAFIVIDDDPALVENARVKIYSDKTVPSGLTSFVTTALETDAEHRRLRASGVPDIERIVADAHAEVSVETIKMADDGSEESSDSTVAKMLGLVFTMLIYMFIFVSGNQVMRAVVEEKTNRIVEVMICSVRPVELMWGKIIAVALVSLTQMAIWVVLTGLFAAVGSELAGVDLAAVADPGVDVSGSSELLAGVVRNDWGLIASMFLLYFIGGYLVYASMFAAVGAAVDNETDTNQMMMPITVIVLFALYAGMYGAENPDGPLAFWCSMIPFTSPFVMMVRLPFGVPVWQLALSLGLLAVTVVAMVWLTARIYRVGILMYGKKPSWRELLRWIRRQ